MRLGIAWTILRKELTETLRDRRTLFMMIVLPVLLYPMVIVAISWFAESQSEAREERASTLAVWGTPPRSLLDELARDSKLSVKAWEGVTAEVREALESGKAAVPAPRRQNVESGGRSARRAGDDVEGQIEEENPVLLAARAAITARQADAIVVIWPGFGAAITGGSIGRLSVYFDSVRLDSAKARERAVDRLDAWRQSVLRERESSGGLAQGFTRAVEVMRRNVAPESRRTGEVLGLFLPFILVTMSLLGAFYPAIDLTAGEKERGTMQTLMCAPLRPIEIIVGKFAAVWVMAAMAAVFNVASLAATLSRLVPGQQLSIPFSAYLWTFAMLVPVTVTTSAAFLAVAAFAKDFKDGQNFLTPVYMVLSMPAAITMVPGVALTPVTAFIPVLNIALLIKALLVGEVASDLAFLTILASAVYAALAVAVAGHVFHEEQVLLGGKQPLRQLLGLERRGGGVPSSSLAIVSFAVLTVLVFYGSLALEGRSIAVTLVVVEYGFFLAPTLALVLGLGFSPREALGLRLPPWQGTLGAVLVGVAAWTFAGGVLVRLLPPPESLVKGLTRIVLLGDEQPSLWAVWLLVGLTPAVCEELYFRGFVLSGLRSAGKWTAIGLSGLLFSLAHSSIYRMLPTLFLGIVFAWIVWKTGSVLCGIIAHALNNGLMASLAVSKGLAASLGGSGGPYLDWRVVCVGTVILATGLLIVKVMPERRVAGRSGGPGV